jgi:hypothetical protein
LDSVLLHFPLGFFHPWHYGIRAWSFLLSQAGRQLAAGGSKTALVGGRGDEAMI